METNNLQLLLDGTFQALVNAGASVGFRTIFGTLSRQFIIYANNNDIDSFSMDIGLQFLDDHYSMTQRISKKKWNWTYTRCINAISDYQSNSIVWSDHLV